MFLHKMALSERTELYRSKMHALNCCVIIPTYNNEKTIAQVISEVLSYSANVIVVNDGATDCTSAILKMFEGKIEILSYSPNKGKGIALRTGLKHAFEQGFRYAITIDSDGQHFADDIPVFLNKIEEEPDSLIVGARNLHQENMPKKNTFGNKISNFWFRFQTGIDLPDTQSGYRLYPLKKIRKTKYYCTKYEFEIEVMVKAAWRGVNVISVPIKVFYAEGDKRVTHFRPGKDFTRISILNVYLTILTVLWYKPVRLIRNMSWKNFKAFIKKHFLDSGESVIRKSTGVAFGVFMGIIPIWGYQFVSALVLAHFLKLNKAIVGLAAQISVPPMIPFIIYGSLKTGQFVLGRDVRESIFDEGINTVPEIWEHMKLHLFEYLLGSVVLAIALAIFFGIVTFIVLKLTEKKIYTGKAANS
jgi:glycosyltransferase involved in cell wall biosynthesis